MFYVARQHLSPADIAVISCKRRRLLNAKQVLETLNSMSEGQRDVWWVNMMGECCVLGQLRIVADD